MEYETLLSGTKWDILSLLSKKEMSPLEISKELGTSVANISMQLKLLEVGNIVQKRRVSNNMAGKPRLLYSLVTDIFYVHIASKNLQLRHSFSLDSDKKIILKIWTLPKSFHGPLMQFYLNHPELFTNEYSVYFSDYGDRVFKLIISNARKPLPPKVIEMEHKGTKFVMDIRFIPQNELEKEKRLVLLHQ